MKKILFILFTLGLMVQTFGQQELKRADTYFERAYYSDAIPLYEQLLPRNKSSKLIKNLADCYYHTFNMKAAARWYGYLVSNYGESVDEDYRFKLNQSLKAIGEYENAQKALIDFYSEQDQDDKVSQLTKDFTYIENVRAIGDRFKIENLNINTATSEFGAARIDSNLVYSASRKHALALPKLYRWNNENYLDIYSHPIDKINLGDSLSTSLSNNINSKMHEGTFAITKDRKTIYFTRNSKKKTEDDKISNLKIYRAEYIDGAWKNIIALPFNSDDFSTEHPALSPDETKLYFSSDREGGFGSFDLYVVNIQKDGFFGNPINLGKEINTDKKEQFPFVDKEGNLYFASNGHPGFGLLDVFVSKKENGNFTKPDNLGLPVNSGYDDFSLSLDPDSITGYFSSNRPGGKGSDDIYSFAETKPLVIEDCKQFIAGVLTDKTTKLPLPDANIELVDANGNRIEKITTSKDASFKFQISCSSEYRIKAHKDGYEDNSRNIVADIERNDVKDGSLTLYSIEEREAQKTKALLAKKEAAEKAALAEIKRQKEQAKIAALERLQKEQEIAHQQKAEQEKEKRERLTKIDAIIAKEDAIVKEKDLIIIKTEEIHFDYSLWYLRREARERLAKVIDIMKQNPGMVIEIGTHTDIRGNAEYNRNLSQKRADSAKEFMVKNGISPERVIAKGYGESQPIVECETVESCTEEDHEWNRRCELIVVKWE
ncbi:OmpA family protein [Maribacter polysiphoniae]|uniref:OmpA family protein n=1 Tax=Maribacter polysiphoniae TaxID=429344 RepID=A0A316EPW3_9FLAO|nr:OmpA family protein [Maribacter polysiphoniae]MBD1259515.1 OmpA family protein [Maribacter polysiphoniae]PWK25080.1 outer membrane protein OmpA-like peptidoglycan-associated protein [Maribacter polysiphoniae]